MAIRKQKKAVKQKKSKTKALSSKKSVKKKSAVKKKTLKKQSAKKSVKKTKKLSSKKSPKKKVVSQKSVSTKSNAKKVMKTPLKTPVPKKKIVQSSYLNGLEQELERILEKNRQVSIKGSEGFEYCFEENCDQPSTTGGYCRYHYMISWDYIKKRSKILSENKLKLWTTELIHNFSPRVLDYMVRDLSNEKDFFTALGEMKLAPKKPVSY